MSERPETPSPEKWDHMIRQTARQARRVVVLVIGSTILLIGIAMLVLPGPATILIPAGLAILATEFVWARRLLRRVRDKVGQVTGRTEAPAEHSAKADREPEKETRPEKSGRSPAP